MAKKNNTFILSPSPVKNLPSTMTTDDLERYYDFVGYDKDSVPMFRAKKSLTTIFIGVKNGR